MHRSLRNCLTSPLAPQVDSINSWHISICTDSPFSVYSFTIAAHCSATVVSFWMWMTVESGSLWVSIYFATLSSLSHSSALDWLTGHVNFLSKCAHFSFASIVFWNQIWKITQFLPHGL